MKKAVTSYGQLINETAFSRVCKASDNLFWTIADKAVLSAIRREGRTSAIYYRAFNLFAMSEASRAARLL